MKQLFQKSLYLFACACQTQTAFSLLTGGPWKGLPSTVNGIGVLFSLSLQCICLSRSEFWNPGGSGYCCQTVFLDQSWWW